MQRFARLALLGLLGGAVAAVPLIPAPASAQQPGQPAVGQDGIEVLARGLVHEAFAASAEMPTAGPIIRQLPPNPVEELPPDEKPEGDNVQWISGYWHFDEEKTDFIWISGFWRVPPPGRVWLPGSWRDVFGGRQWVRGFWQEIAPAQFQQPQAPQQLEYLPPPPQPLEFAPSVPRPDATSFYVPGSWMWRGHYVWRPGYWVGYRPNWVWVPAHYRATPGGYLFIDGYWDYPLERRGVLFAPVYFSPVVLNRRAFFFTPSYAVSYQGMFGALFVRRGYSSYYFGDYFEPRYTTLGFNAWCGSSRGTSFALNVNVGRGAYYDPLWSHYQIQHRADPVFVTNIQNVYVGRYNGEVARPARTLVQQTTVVNNITNVTNTTVNNTTVNNVTNNVTNNKVVNSNNNVTNLTMIQPLKTMQESNANVVLKTVPKAEQVKEQALVKQTRDIGVERNRAETQLAAKQLAPALATDKPRQVKLDVPQQVVARAQAPEKPQFVLPPKPTPRQADLNAKAPPTIPPATDLTKPAPGVPTKPVAPTVKEMPTKPLPVTPLPVNPVLANPQPAKPLPLPTPVMPVKPEAKPAPLVPTPATPLPVKPLPLPVKPEAKPVPPLPTPTNPTPVTPLPVPSKPLPNPAPVLPAKPLPPVTPAKPDAKPAVPVAPMPLPPKLGVPPPLPPVATKPITLPPMAPPPVVQAQKAQPAPVQPPPQRPEVRLPQLPPPAQIPPARPEMKAAPVNVPQPPMPRPAPPAPRESKDPKDAKDPKKPG